jgi:hypothetical protein
MSHAPARKAASAKPAPRPERRLCGPSANLRDWREPARSCTIARELRKNVRRRAHSKGTRRAPAPGDLTPLPRCLRGLGRAGAGENRQRHGPRRGWLLVWRVNARAGAGNSPGGGCCLAPGSELYFVDASHRRRLVRTGRSVSLAFALAKRLRARCRARLNHSDHGQGNGQAGGGVGERRGATGRSALRGRARGRRWLRHGAGRGPGSRGRRW